MELRDGAVVVRHRADGAEAEHLARVGERLAAAAHPGVVAVVRSGPEGDGWELATVHAGTPLAPHSVTPARLATVASDVAATLGALHERGIVHGRLTAGRILVGADGHAVLCGLGPGEEATSSTPEDDVAALGRIVAEVAAGLVATAPGDDGTLGRLVAVAARAQADPPSRRPSAERLARDLRAGPDRPSTAPRPRCRAARPRAAALAGALVIVVAGGALLLGGPEGEPAPASGAAQPQATSSTVAPRRAPPCVAREGSPVAAPDCGHRAVVEGPVVVVDEHRSVVGRAGDEVVVADWGCDGELRPAVLRPSTGEVLVLSAPGPDGGRAVELARRVPGATALEATTGADGCAAPQVAVEDGPPVVLTPAEAPADG